MTDSRTIYTNDFLDRMAAGRQNALNRRNRGLAVGSHASWNVKRSDYAPVDQTNHAHHIASIIEAWRGGRMDAVDQFRFDVNGGWEGFE